MAKKTQPAQPPSKSEHEQLVEVLQQDPGPSLITLGINIVTKKVSFTMTHTHPLALQTYISMMQQVIFELQKKLEETSSTKDPNAS